MIRALFFLAALAVVALIVTGAIRLQKSDDSITIQIDKARVAEDARAAIGRGKQVLQNAEASLDQQPERSSRTPRRGGNLPRNYRRTRWICRSRYIILCPVAFGFFNCRKPPPGAHCHLRGPPLPLVHRSGHETLSRAASAARYILATAAARGVARRPARARAAAPWQNTPLPLDVNHDSIVENVDALIIINRLLQVGISALPALPEGTLPTNYYDTNGDNMLSPGDAIRAINSRLKPNTLVLDALMPFTADVTPRLLVQAAGTGTIAEGATVHIDVDLDNDGEYVGNELDYMTTTIYEGRSEFALTPALPVNGPSGIYSINLRARVPNALGVMQGSGSVPLQVDTQTSDALYNYVNTPDPSYHYSLASTTVDPSGLFTYYVIDMTSQTWRLRRRRQAGLAPLAARRGSHRHAGRHLDAAHFRRQQQLWLPAGLLLQRHRHHQNRPDHHHGPGHARRHRRAEGRAQRAGVFLRRRSPPTSRSEDEIIAYTLNQWLEGIGEPDNDTWPLLLPMVKSAVRAMDTIQSFVPTVTDGHAIDDFVVSGYSKRGWTTWLTAAADDRVRAIIPGVFDNLNQGPQMVHHVEAYGHFSEEVEDYTNLQIFERMKTPEAQLLLRIVDPYRYLRNGRFDDMPKLVLNSAGDEFFVTDSSQFYFDDLPGEDNYMRYIPPRTTDSSGHGLNESAIYSTVSFMDAVLNNRHLPDFSWQVKTDGTIEVHTVDAPSQVVVWQASAADSRDYRHGYHPDILWSSQTLNSSGGGVYSINMATPATGSIAYFIELTFPSSVPGVPYVFTTDVHVKTKMPLFPWPYADGGGGGGGGSLSAGASYSLQR